MIAKKGWHSCASHLSWIRATFQLSESRFERSASRFEDPVPWCWVKSGLWLFNVLHHAPAGNRQKTVFGHDKVHRTLRLSASLTPGRQMHRRLTNTVFRDCQGRYAALEVHLAGA